MPWPRLVPIARSITGMWIAMFKFYFEYFHCWLHAAIHAVEAELASYRGDIFTLHEQESLKREWERRMDTLEVNRRMV